MKFLLLLLATAFFVVGGDQAEAAPVIGAIAAISSAIAKIGIIGKFIIGVALTVGQSLLAKAMAKKADKSTQTTGVDLSVSMGDDVPLSFTVGTYATGGKRKYIGTWGSDGNTPNAYLVDVIELENLPSSGLAGLWAGDTKCNILWAEPHPNGLGFPVSEYRRGGADYLWVRFADGSQTVADAYLRDKFGGNVDRRWTSDMIGRGCAYAVLTCRYNSDVFSSGLPDWAFEMAPRKFYDLRKDSTNGGFGPHRWNDPSTWEPTSNVVIVAYNIIRGISYGDEWVYGGQNVAAFRLPASNCIAAANECNAAVLLADGTTEPAFRCGYEINVDREPLDVLEELQKAGNMRIAEVGGVFKFLVGAPGAAVYSFTDDDIIITEGQNLSPFPTFGETFNGIEATYPEPAEKWASKDAPARYDAGLEIEDDNNRLPAGVAFDAVPFALQVQRLMVGMINDYRRFRVHQFYLPPDAYPLEPNDVVSWSSDKNGYQEKKFLVTAITGQRTFNRLASFKEIDPSDYDWSVALQLPTTTGWIGKISPPVQVLSGWQVEPAVIENAAGTSQRPSIKVSCAPNQDGVTNVWVQVRLASTQAIVFDSDATRYAAPYAWKLNGTFTPNTAYEVSGEFISDINRNQQRSGWLPVTTPNVLISTADLFDNAITASKIADAAVSASKLMDEAVTGLKLADQAVSTAKLQVGAVTKEIVANGAIIADKIANGAIEAMKFAAGIQPVTIVAGGALPVVKSTDTINFMGELYTWNGTAYTKPETGIPDGSVTAAKLADAAVTAAKLASQAVTNDKIAANSIYGSVIAAGSITARELILTDFTNLLQDAYFEDVTAATINSIWNFTGGTYVQQNTSPGAIACFRYASGAAWVKTGATAFVLQKDPAALATSIYMSTNARIPVTAGETLQCAVTLRASGVAASAGFYFRIYWYDASGADVAGTGSNFSDVISNVGVTVAFETKTAQVVVPATATQCRVRIYNHSSNTTAQLFVIDSVSLRRANAAELIVDGGITATKLAVNSVTANAIAANAITAANISAGAVSADKIAANSITASKLSVIDTSNLIDGTLNDPAAWSGGLSSSWSILQSSDALDNAQKVLQYAAPANTGANSAYKSEQNSNFFPVMGGKDYAFGLTVRGTDTTKARFQFIVRFYDKDTVNLSGPQVGATQFFAGATTPVALSGILTAPLNATTGRLFLRISYNGIDWSPALIFRDLYARVAANAELVVDGTITTAKLNALAVTAEKIGALAVTAEKVAASAITADKIAAGAITADKVAANTITGDKLVANTITARNLVLTDFSNIIANPLFTTDLAGWWATTTPSPTRVASPGTNPPYPFSAYIASKAAALNELWYGPQGAQVIAPCNPGDVFYYEAWVYCPSGTDTSLRLLLRVGNSINTTRGSAFATVTPNQASDTWLRVSGQLTVPAAIGGFPVSMMGFLFSNINNGTATNGWYVTGAVLRKAANASLIVDGSVTAAKIAANSITADKMNVTSLSAISATLGNVDIGDANISRLIVGTSNIEPGAISAVFQQAGGTSASITVNHGTGSPLVMLMYSGRGNTTNNNPGRYVQWSITNTTSGAGMDIFYVFNPGTYNGQVVTASSFKFYTPPSGVASTTFSIVGAGTGMAANSCDIAALVMKK